MRIRTGYSFKYAFGYLPEVLDRLVEIGWQVAPLSDRNSTFGFANWTKFAKERGLRPLYGCELPVVADASNSKPVYDYWTFFAKDSLTDLHEAVWQATGGVECFDYAAALALPGVVRILSNRTMLDRLTPTDDVFLPLSPSTPRGQYRLAIERGFKFIASGDNVYTRPEDLEAYKLVVGRNASTQTYPQHILSDDEWRALCSYAVKSDLDAATHNRNVVIDLCRAELRKAEMYVPKKAKSLREMCMAAVSEKVPHFSDIYKARLDRELTVIAEKKFEDYFYIIADMMQWARKQMVVGPARGSSCGSLVCYLLGITAIDPIKYDLIFERFIDTSRPDLPDIDLDFSDAQRHRVFEYMDKTYGKEHVARLGLVLSLKSRLALGAAAAALKIPKWQTNELINAMAKHAAGDEKAGQLLSDVFTRTDIGRDILKEFPNATIAGRIEGHPFAAGQHAAGLILTRDPINHYVAVDASTGATMCDKRDAEALNLLKIDMLGLTQLSIFERTMKLIGVEARSGWLEQIPIDEQAAFDVLNAGKFSGVFQFAPRTMLANLVTELVKTTQRLDNIEDLVALTSLVRPGPLTAGAAHAWIRRRGGLEPAESFHPLLDPILGKTFGLMVYQEQIMRIGREVGDLSWDEVMALRKAMGKSMGADYFNRLGDKWKQGAVAKGMTSEQADKIWSDMCGFGAYAFNRSHAVAYGMVSYWCCWLKAHYPVEFAAATLDSLNDQANQVTALREMRDEGIDYVPVDVEHSTMEWSVNEYHGRKRLVGPLTNIKGIAAVKARQAIAARESGDKEKFNKIIKKTDTKIDSLSPIRDHVCALFPDYNKTIEPVDIGNIEEGQMVYVLGKVTKVILADANDPKAVAKRGYSFKGATDVLKLGLADDTGEITCLIGRHEFPSFGREIAEQAKANKSFFAIQGTVPVGFRMVQIKRIKHLGDV